MSNCVYINPETGTKSTIHQKLKDVTNNEALADLEFFNVLMPDFQKWFSYENWEANYKDRNQSVPLSILDINMEPMLFKDDVGYYYKNNKGDVKYISASKLSAFSRKNLDEIIGELSASFIATFDLEDRDIREVIESINTDVHTFIKKYATERLESTTDPQLKDRLVLILKNSYDLSAVIKDNFRRFNIEVIEETNIEEKTSNEVVGKDSTSINSKDRATANIKLMLAFAPKQKLTNDMFEPVIGDYLGGVVTAEFNKIWSLLENSLAGIVPSLGTEGKFVRLLDRFIEKIVDKSEKHPELAGVLSMIFKKQSNEQIMTQFVQAFFKTKGNYVDTVIDNGIYKIMDSSQNTVGNQLMDQWFENLVYASSLVDKSDNTFKTEQAKKLKINYDIFTNEVRQSNLPPSAHFDRLIKYLEYIGITGVTPEVLETFFTDAASFKEFISGTTNSINNLITLVSNLNAQSIINTKGGLKNPLLNERIFKNLANAVAEQFPEATESTILTKDGLAWLFDLTNFMDLNIGIWKDGEIAELETRINDIPYYRHSVWAKKIVEAVKNKDTKFLDGLRILFLNNLRKDKDVRDNKDITFDEQLADSIAKLYMVNPMMNMLEPADKSRFIHIQGFDRLNVYYGVKFDKTIGINAPEAIDQLYGYFLDEYDRVKDEFTKPSTVEYYGNGLNSKKVVNNRLKFQIFETVFNKFKNELQFSDGRLMAAIPAEISVRIKEEITKQLESKVKSKAEEVKKIFKSLPDTVKKEAAKSTHGAEHIAANFLINGMIANIEMTKLFTGDPAYYANMTDFKKRIPATYTNGVLLDLRSAEDIFFNVAIAQDVEYGSDFLSNNEEYVKNVATATGETEDKVKEILSSYDSLDRTDAQAYITIDRWKFLMERTGKFGKAEESAYNNIINGEPTPKDIKLTAQPLKGVYFSVLNGKPVYLKYSQAVLIPGMVKGTQLETLADSMKASKAQELIFLSGTKVGATDVNTIHDAEGNIKITEPLKVMQLDNRFWKLQQDLPTKGMKEIAIGSQIQKNVFSDFSMEGTWDFAGTPTSGAELHEIVDEAFRTLSDRGANKIRKELYTNGKVDKEKVKNLLISEVLRSGNDENLLTALRKGLPYDSIPHFKGKIISIIQSKVTGETTKVKALGGAFIQMANFGLDRMTAKERGSIYYLTPQDKLKPPMIVEGKVRPGQVFLPHSAIAKYIPNFRELSPEEFKRRIDSRLFELIGYRIPNQGMSSNDFLEVVGILPESMGDTIVAYTEITKKTGSDFDIDKMYAILPAFKATYESPIEVVRNFFDSRDNIISRVLEKEGLIEDAKVKTQSLRKLQEILLSEDFETDNQAILDIQNEYEDYLTKVPVEVTRLEYISHEPVDGKALSRKAYHNRIFQAYKAILTDTKTYLALVTSIDKSTQILKDDINDMYPDVDGKKVGFDHIDPFAELHTKKNLVEGKNGVGTTANNLVDHVISQLFPLVLNEDIGFGRRTKLGRTDMSSIMDTENGNKITDIISAFLNAFVDIAKDPYIFRANYNDFTSGVAFLLLRAGTPVKDVTRFIGQPVLKKFAEYSETEKSVTTPSFFIKVGKDTREVTAKVFIQDEYKNKVSDENASRIEAMSLSELHNTFFSRANLENNLKRADVNTQYAILTYFNKLKVYATDLQSIVKATKSDVVGATSTAYERQTFENNHNNAIKNIHFTGVKERFEGTRFGAFYHNSMGLATEISKELFLDETDGARITKSIMTSMVSPMLATNDDFQKLLSQEYFAYVMTNTGYFPSDREKLLKELPFKLIKYREKHPDNPFLNKLRVNKKEKIFIELESTRNKTDFEKNSIYNGWKDLFFSGEEGYALGRELIQYSFITSGFSHGVGRFFTAIPHDWVGWEMLDEAIKQEFQKLNDPEGKYASSIMDNFFDQFIKHHYEKKFGNIALVRTVPAKTFTVSKDKVFRTVSLDAAMKSGIAKQEVGGPVIWTPYLRTRIYQEDGYGNSIATNNFTLYKLQGLDEQGNGMYTIQKKMGYEKSGSRIMEYSRKPNAPIAIEAVPAMEAAVDTNFDATITEFDFSMMESVGDFDAPVSTTPIKEEVINNTSIEFQEEPITGYRNRTIKNASADATIALAVDFNSAGEKLTKSSVLNQGKKYIAIDANKLEVTKERVDKIVEVLNSVNKQSSSVTSIPQNLVSGIESFGTKQEANSEVKKILGNSPHSIDMIEAGLRTRTTRSIGEMEKYNIKVGDIVTQFGKSSNGTTKQILTRITAIHPKGTPGFLGTWNKEGWTQEGITAIERYKDGAAAIEFEIVNPSITLNIAGNGIYTMKGKYTQEQVDDFTFDLLNQVINSPNLKNKIESIRSGGQTGFDEAGVKAGIKLGLPTTILAPKGWTFRDVTGKDISNEEQFKSRFNNNEFATEQEAALAVEDNNIKTGTVIKIDNKSYTVVNDTNFDIAFNPVESEKNIEENLDNSDINYIFALSGKSMTDLGLTQEVWNTLSEEERITIIHCN